MLNQFLPWILFNVFVLAMLALDLGVFHGMAHEVKIKKQLEIVKCLIVRIVEKSFPFKKKFLFLTLLPQCRSLEEIS